MRLFSPMLQRFRRSEDGTIVIESLLIIPFLLWAYLALYTYWDAYRAMTMSQKAAYTISDMISREQTPVNSAYILGMKNTMDYMLSRDFDTTLRVSSVVYEVDNNEMRIEWSRSTNSALTPELTTASLQALVPQIPEMNDGDTVILVETWVEFEPALRIGLEDTTYREFIVTRPRFAPRITIQ
jgi:Flp pilus assembly protein TadG